jgi:hypothetical protein
VPISPTIVPSTSTEARETRCNTARIGHISRNSVGSLVRQRSELRS